jgi:siroheme synthase-like protein
VKLLPVALNVAEKRCLLVGGGVVAQRKAASLLECGAHVSVIAPRLCDAFGPLRGQIEYSERTYHSGDCDRFQLVFACTNRREVNAAVAAEACLSRIWCNVADDPQGSDLHTVATVRRGPVCIGISTGAASPVLARHVKEEISTVIGDEYARLLQIVSEAQSVREASPEGASFLKVRTAARRCVARHPGKRRLPLLRAGQNDEAKKLLAGLLK